MSRATIKVGISLLSALYLVALIVSTTHLATITSLFTPGQTRLDRTLAIVEALAFEFGTFALTMLSHFLHVHEKRGVQAGAYLGMALVLAGNTYAMYVAAPHVPLAVTACTAMSLTITTLFCSVSIGVLVKKLRVRPTPLQPLHVPYVPATQSGTHTPSAQSADTAPQLPQPVDIPHSVPAEAIPAHPPAAITAVGPAQPEQLPVSAPAKRPRGTGNKPAATGGAGTAPQPTTLKEERPLNRAAQQRLVDALAQSPQPRSRLYAASKISVRDTDTLIKVMCRDGIIMVEGNLYRLATAPSQVGGTAGEASA